VAKRVAWWAYGALGLAVVASYLWLPSLRWQNIAYDGLGASVAVALVVAAVRSRGVTRIAWALFGAARVSNTIADIWYDIIYARDGSVSSPSIVDFFYLMFYPLSAAALLMLARSGTLRRRWDTITDALIAATAATLVLWVLVRPTVVADGVSATEAIITLAYPVADLVLLVLTLRLLLGPGLRSVALSLLIVSTFLTIAGDLLYFVATTTYGGLTPGGPGDLLWMLSYVAFGVAALHPSAPLIGQPGPEPPELVRRRVALLVVSGLLPVAVVLVAWPLGRPVEVVPFVIGTSVLFLLLLSRVVGVARGHEQTIHREQILREAGISMVTATSAGQMKAVALQAAQALVGHWFSVELSTPDDARSTVTERDMMVSLGGPGERNGVLVVHGAMSPPPGEIRQSLASLASTVELALEAAAQNEERQRGESRFRSIVYGASDLMLVLRPDTTIEWCAGSVESITGYRVEDLIGQPFAVLLHPDDAGTADYFVSALQRLGSSARAEARLRMRDGTFRTFDLAVRNLMSDPAVAGLVLTGSDITKQRRLEDELRDLASHDQLTGLASRGLFVSRLRHSLVEPAPVEHEHNLAVVFVDLDDFKTVNDSLGHDVGDELLQKVGGRLVQWLRPADIAARFGGDEFAVLLDNADQGQAADVARRILEGFREPFRVAHQEVFARASIGVATADGNATAETVLRNADMAMYQAKTAGKNRVEVFEPSMHAMALRRLQLHGDVRRALDRNEFVLHYQPIVDLQSGELTGYEALVRWQHPTEGLIQPNDFIPFAEETGLIVPLGQWILRQACEQAALWQQRFRPSLTMSVNLSVRQLAEPAIVADVVAAIDSTGLPSSSLILEVTESALASDIDAISAKLRQLDAIGVQIAIDDFGTGYASLNYLKQFPARELKIDRTFVSAPPDRTNRPTLVNMIIDLAHSLQLSTVAEGVETQAQLVRLRDLGCALGQGFYFSHPRDAANTERSLASGTPYPLP
jgi:diguanylate cyclase (GGDEF)-like protein/PAS domain S-box-containing protein